MTAHFNIGDRVRIDARAETRHHRAPAYVKGRTGDVVRVCRSQAQPENAAQGGAGGGGVQVCRVRLKQADLWSGYTGAAHDTLDIEMHGHWLTRAED